MNKIKILRPKYKIPLKDILDLFRKELNAEILNKNSSEINNTIEKNKKYFNHIGVGQPLESCQFRYQCKPTTPVNYLK